MEYGFHQLKGALAFLLRTLLTPKQSRLLRTRPTNSLTILQNPQASLETKTPSDHQERLLVPLISCTCHLHMTKINDGLTSKRLREEAYYAVKASVKEMHSDGIQAWSHLGGIRLTAVLILCNGLMSATWSKYERSKLQFFSLKTCKSFYVAGYIDGRTGQSEPKATSALPFKREWNR